MERKGISIYFITWNVNEHNWSAIGAQLERNWSVFSANRELNTKYWSKCKVSMNLKVNFIQNLVCNGAQKERNWSVFKSKL